MKDKWKRWWKDFFPYLKFWFCWHFADLLLSSVLDHVLVRFSAEPWLLLISRYSGDQFDKCWWALNYSRKTIIFPLVVSWLNVSRVKWPWVHVFMKQCFCVFSPQVSPVITDQCVSWSGFFKLACWLMVSSLSDD